MRLLLVALSHLLMSACVYQQQGNRFDVDAVKQFQPGITSDQDAAAKLAQPMAVSTYENGNRLLQWQYVFGTAIGVGGGAHAATLFGPDGKMTSVALLSKQ